MIIIEFFSPPISGKSYTFNNIVYKELKKKFKISTYQKFFFDNIFYEKKFSFLNYLTLKYFQGISLRKKIVEEKIQNSSLKIKKLNYGFKIKNILGNYFYKNYNKIIDEYFLKYKLNNFDLTKLYFENLKKLNVSKKKKNNYIRWFKEICAQRYILEKYSSDKMIILQDEGIFQRVFLSFAEKELEKKKLNKLLKFIPKVDYIIYQDSLNIKKKWIDHRKKLNNKFNYKNNLDKKKYLKKYRLVMNLIKKNK